MPGNERRQHLRTPVKMRAVGLFARPFLRRDCAVLDVSPHGAQVEVENPRGIVLGAKCTLKVFKGGKAGTIVVEAVVVSVAGANRFGLEIRSFDIEALTTLGMTLAQGGPAAHDREASAG